jgi:flagellar biogenesis protein FliO
MRFLQGTKGRIDREQAVEVQGIAKRVFSMLRDLYEQRDVQDQQMQLMETLALGGKKQLMLVSCGGERFLVGGGSEGIETIVPVKTERLREYPAKNQDEICH